MILRWYGIYPRLVNIMPEGSMNNQLKGYCILPKEQSVNHFVAKELQSDFRIILLHEVGSYNGTRRLIVSVRWLLPNPKTLSVACSLAPYSMAEDCCHNKQILLSLFRSICCTECVSLSHRFTLRYLYAVSYSLHSENPHSPARLVCIVEHYVVLF